MCLKSECWGGRGEQIPGTHWPASVTYFSRPARNNGSTFKKKKKEIWIAPEDQGCLLDSHTCTCMLMHEYTHRHTLSRSCSSTSAPKLGCCPRMTLCPQGASILLPDWNPDPTRSPQRVIFDFVSLMDFNVTKGVCVD